MMMFLVRLNVTNIEYRVVVVPFCFIIIHIYLFFVFLMVVNSKDYIQPAYFSPVYTI